jgi:hypothetical protein
LAKKTKSAAATGDDEFLRERGDPCNLSRKETRDEFNLMLGLAWRARENPHRLFTVEELASIMAMSIDSIKKMRACGAPFPFGKSRPEWLHTWMLEHPTVSHKSDKTTC